MIPSPPATSTASKGCSQEESIVVKPSPGLQKKIAGDKGIDNRAPQLSTPEAR
jgi:hypothetical protein